MCVSQQNIKLRKAKLLELPRETDKSIITVGYFNNPLSEMDTPRRQKISKDTVKPKTTTNQMDVTDINRPLYPTTF